MRALAAALLASGALFAACPSPARAEAAQSPDGQGSITRPGGVTLAVVGMDMLLEPSGFLDELRQRGYTIESP
jgi:hypothetical protein